MTTINLPEAPLQFINGVPPSSPDSEYRFYKCTLKPKQDYTCQQILYDDRHISSYNTTLIPISKKIPQLFDKGIIYYTLFPRITLKS